MLFFEVLLSAWKKWKKWKKIVFDFFPS